MHAFHKNISSRVKKNQHIKDHVTLKNGVIMLKI